MAWLQIDDRVRTHPKIVKAGPDAAWFWFCSVCYCREHLTDGFIPSEMLASLVPGVRERKAMKLVHKLTDVRLWHTAAGGYHVHDFLDWNPSRASVEARRAEDRARKSHGGHAPNSGRIPKDKGGGPRQDSEDPRARAVGDGLGSGSESVSGLEGGAGGTMPAIGPRPLSTRDAKPLIVSPLAHYRKHGDHLDGFCDWMCFPSDLAHQFAQRVADSRRIPIATADEFVANWARTLRDSGVIPTGKMYDFWNAQWEASFGPFKPTTDGAQGRHQRNQQRLDDFVENG